MNEPTGSLEKLSLQEKVGQLFAVGIGPGHLQTGAGWPGEDMQRVVEELQPGAVRIYGTHETSPHFVAQYVNQLQRWAESTDHELPLLISSDCEYGTVDVVRDGPQAYPSLMGRTATGDPALARNVSSAITRDMLSMGISMTHQPIVDVNTNPHNPIIGVRSPGNDPETVSRYASALLDGIRTESGIAVAKHFPGHGDTESDSHHELPHVRYDRETLEAVHLEPFRRMIAEGIDCIMTAHVVVDCLDPDRPATLSEAVLTDLLRSKLGFDGVVVTDSMAMDAVDERYGFGDAVVESIGAGANLVLTGQVPAADLFEARDAVVDAVETNDLAKNSIDESVERLIGLKRDHDLQSRRYADPLGALEKTRREDHETLAREAYEQSYTVVEGDTETLPLTDTTSILVTGVRGVRAIEPALAAAFGSVVSHPLAENDPRASDGPAPTVEPESSADEIETLRSLSDCVDVAVVTTFTNDRFRAGQRRIIEALAGELPTVVVSLGLPNELDGLPDDVTYVATYAQERLGRPSPFPKTACEALVETLRRSHGESGDRSRTIHPHHR